MANLVSCLFDNSLAAGGGHQRIAGQGCNDLGDIHNDTVVVDTRVGEFNNKHRFVTDKYGIPLEKVLLQSLLVPWSYFASNFYLNVYWFPLVGRPRVQAAVWTRWGKRFEAYGDGQVVMPGMEPKTVIQAAVGLGALAASIGLGAW